jgi:hypothetical protein
VLLVDEMFVMFVRGLSDSLVCLYAMKKIRAFVRTNLTVTYGLIVL